MGRPTLHHGSSRGLLRRRWPRLDVAGTLVAHINALDITMNVRDVSLGGFAVEAPVRFARGEVHELIIEQAGQPAIPIRARVAYCHGRDREHVFFTGWEALGDPATSCAMAALVERILGATAAASEAVAAGGQAQL